MMVFKAIIKYPSVRKYIFNRILNLFSLRFKKFKYKYEENLKFDTHVEKILKNISDNFKLNIRLKDPIRKIIEANPIDLEKKMNEKISIINDNLKYKIKTNFSDLENKTIDVLEKGYTLLDSFKISSEDRLSVITKSKKIDCYNQHCNYLAHETKEPWQIQKQKSYYASYDLEDIVKIDELCKIIFDPRICDLAYKTLGCIPTFYGLNLRWSFHTDGKLIGPQQFHRDIENLKCVNFIYNFTETNKGDGSHIYVQRTHNLNSLSKIFDVDKNLSIDPKYQIKNNMSPKDFFTLPFSGYGLNPLIEHYFKDNIKYILNDNIPILENNYGFHAADVPMNDRCVLLIHFALSGSLPSASGSKDIKRIPYNNVSQYFDDNLNNRYIYRNLVKF
jgi:hypothetical protein